MSKSNLAGKVAVVTGGAAGVGAALCRRLAARDATVVIADLDIDAGAPLADEIGAEFVSFDVSDRGEWQEHLATVVDRFGGLDLLALNAGVMSRPKGVPFAGDDPLDWLRDRYQLVRSVNMDGVVFGITAAVPHLRARGGGRIVVTASSAGLTALPQDPGYAMSKHAVVGLVRSLRRPLAEDGIGIAAVCPGGIDTSMIPPDSRTPDSSFASPDHVADALEQLLDMDLDTAGSIWVTLGEDDPLRRYEFAPIR